MSIEARSDKDINVPNNDTISRQAAIDAPKRFTKDCNPEHFVGHSNFIEYMDTVGIRSFGNWQYANGFNMGLTAAEVAIEKLPSAQNVPDRNVGEWDMFELITSVWYGKQCYFVEENGVVYSRVSCKYMSVDEAIKEFLGRIGDNG